MNIYTDIDTSIHINLQMNWIIRQTLNLDEYFNEHSYEYQYSFDYYQDDYLQYDKHMIINMKVNQLSYMNFYSYEIYMI